MLSISRCIAHIIEYSTTSDKGSNSLKVAKLLAFLLTCLLNLDASSLAVNKLARIKFGPTKLKLAFVFK